MLASMALWRLLQWKNCTVLCFSRQYELRKKLNRIFSQECPEKLKERDERKKQWREPAAAMAIEAKTGEKGEERS
jgi:hypothetical protein